jgi:ABC-type multidrug transport system fused ATPase/permease subunit
MESTLQISWMFIKEHPLSILLYTFFTLLSFPLETILVPRIYSAFLDDLKKPTLRKDTFIRFFVTLFVVLVVVNGSALMSLYIESILIPEMFAFFYDFIFVNLLAKNENQMGEIEMAKIITRLHILPETLCNLINNICVWCFPRILTVIAVNIYFFILHWKLGATSMALLAAHMTCNYFLFEPCINHVREMQTVLESKNQYTQDKLSNVFAIYSSGSKDVEIEAYRKNTEHYTGKYKDSLNCMQKSTAISTVIVIITYLLLIIVPSLLFWNGEITLFLLVSIIITVIFYVPSIVDLNAIFPRVANDIGVLASSDDFIKELYDVHVKTQGQTVAAAASADQSADSGLMTRSDIVIRDLSFEYLPGKPVFQNFNLTITERQNVAIVGPSGNGKSTLIKLIMGYYPVPDGHIFLGGKDLNHYSLNDLRKQMTYVHQQPQLFNVSVLENIQYGNDASRESIIEFMDRHGLAAIFRKGGGDDNKNTSHDFLDTRVGIDGGNLSGGQKQMVLILRALMSPKMVVILDEPTTAIDKDNKALVIRAIALLCQTATVILITHERELLALADRIVTIDSGRIKNDEMISRIRGFESGIPR